MLASLAALVSHHPARLFGHLQLYGDLMSAETAHAMRHLLHRLTYVVLAVELAACAVMLTGVATMLAITVADGGSWTLWLVPALPAVGALLAWLKLRDDAALAPFATLRRQVAADAEWLAHRERTEAGELTRTL